MKLDLDEDSQFLAKLSNDIDATFSHNMTDFDLDGEVDSLSRSKTAPTSPFLETSIMHKKRAGWKSN